MSLKGKEILVIDDDSQYQFFVNNILSNLGITITQAKNYDEALKCLKESIPHLIITDIKLNDGKDGLNIQKFLKENKRFKAIPVFVITADATRNTIFQSLALGANEYIIKPLIAKDLIQKIRRLFMDYEAPEVKFIDENTGKYKPEFEMSFENDFNVEIELDFSLRAINELSCILQGPVKFPKESIVDLKSDLLNSIGGDGLGFRSIENSRTIEAGTFSTRFSLVGINEKVAQKIRALRVTKS